LLQKSRFKFCLKTLTFHKVV